MEEYTIITQGNATYLETMLGTAEKLDPVDHGMLVSNKISGLLPLSVQWINAGCRLLYNITGLTPLEQAARILEHETRLRNFFLALCKAEKECDEYLLDPHKIDLNPKNVYLDATGRAYVLYRPVQVVQSNYDPMKLTHYVFRLVGQQMSQDSRVVNVLSRQLLYEGKFTFAELEPLLKEQPAPQSQPKVVQKEPVRPAPVPPVQQPGNSFEPVEKPQPNKIEQPKPCGVPETGKQQDNPFAKKMADNPFAATSEDKPEEKPSTTEKKAEKKEEKKEKKSGGFLGLFGGKKDKKKASQSEHENPFKQETPVPEQPVHKAAVAAPEHVPQQPSGGCTVVLSSGQGSGNVRTTIMGSGSGAESELYLVQKDTNQYVHVTHTNFHIGRAEDVVDFTVHTKNCYLGNDHAYILIENGSYYIVDNNTQNHTYLNEQRLEPSKPVRFHAGDTIRMADVVFSVVAGS